VQKYINYEKISCSQYHSPSTGKLPIRTPTLSMNRAILPLQMQRYSLAAKAETHACYEGREHHKIRRASRCQSKKTSEEQCYLSLTHHKFCTQSFSARRTLKDSLLPITSARMPHVVAPTINPANSARIAYSTRTGLSSCCTWGRATARPWNHISSDHKHVTYTRATFISLSASHPRPVSMNSCH
jgi:hypothetical protein